MELKANKVKMTSELKVGDWIYLQIGDVYHKGWVTRILDSTTLSMFRIGYYKKEHSESPFSNKPYVFYEATREYKGIITNDWTYNVLKEKDLTFSDLEYKRDLLNLAIDTRDKKWFEELAQ